MVHSWCVSLHPMWLDHFTWVMLSPTPYRILWLDGNYNLTVQQLEIQSHIISATSIVYWDFCRPISVLLVVMWDLCVWIAALSPTCPGTGCEARPACGTQAVITLVSPPRWWWRKSWWEREAWAVTIWAGRISSRKSGNGRMSEWSKWYRVRDVKEIKLR